MKKEYLIAMLILILFASGCVEGRVPDIFKGLIGEQGLETKELPPDIIIVQNQNVIPKPPIPANSEFTISFEVKNQAEAQDVDNVGVELYDWGICTPPDADERTKLITTLVPQQVEYLEWKFTAPTNDLIAHMESKCPIRYMVNYTFNTSSQVDVQVISSNRLSQLQRAGQTPTFSPTQSVGIGPLKIYFDFGVALPVRTNETYVESILPIYITIEDKGTGLLHLEKGYIKAGSITLKIPKEFIEKGDPCSGKFKKTNGPELDKYNYYTNKEKEIPMVKRKSPQIRCAFFTPDNTTVPIEKTYFISTSMNYVYDLVEETEVAIKPVLGV